MHYTGTIWRPPYEASSLLLEVTAGCTHHQCKFCTLYEDLPFRFRMSPMEDVEEDLKEARQRYRMWKGYQVSRTFLTGANPFVLKAEKLLRIGALIRKYFPENRSIGCFARVTDVKGKTDPELRALHEAGFDGLTIGIETGDEEALRFMKKGYGAQDIVDQCRRLDKAGIHYHFFYLTGISGAGKGEQGAKVTARICNQVHPQRMVANMLTIYPNSELYKELQKGDWTEESELEKYRELKALVEHLTVPVIFGALGASNAIQIQGRLPRDREKLLEALDEIIHGFREEELRNYRVHLKHL